MPSLFTQPNNYMRTLCAVRAQTINYTRLLLTTRHVYAFSVHTTQQLHAYAVRRTRLLLTTRHFYVFSVHTTQQLHAYAVRCTRANHQLYAFVVNNPTLSEVAL
jgi:hypothetical protein